MSTLLLHAILTVALVGSDAVKDLRFIAHEWGTFTTVAGKDGEPLKWHPLNGSSELPTFVYTLKEPRLETNDTDEGWPPHNPCECVKCSQAATVRMETPVIYFYTDRPLTASVRVDFQWGRITEWYPQAGQRSANLQSIEWKSIQMLPGLKPDLPRDPSHSHYYPARATDADPLLVSGEDGEQYEKFLFYRGIGVSPLPVRAMIEGETVRVQNTTPEPIAQVILFENRNGRIGYRIHAGLKEEVVLERPSPAHSMVPVVTDLKKGLIAQGLYEKEAEAMIQTWREAWFEEGLRVFYIVPRAVTDAVLPIAIEPKPTELVRVLVGRIELITPEMEEGIRSLVEMFTTVPQQRDRAVEGLKRYGRFAEPVLSRLYDETNDAAAKEKIVEFVKSVISGQWSVVSDQ